MTARMGDRDFSTEGHSVRKGELGPEVGVEEERLADRWYLRSGPNSACIQGQALQEAQKKSSL